MTFISITPLAKGGQAPTQRPDALLLITALLELPGIRRPQTQLKSSLIRGPRLQSKARTE